MPQGGQKRKKKKEFTIKLSMRERTYLGKDLLRSFWRDGSVWHKAQTSGLD